MARRATPRKSRAQARAPSGNGYGTRSQEGAGRRRVQRGAIVTGSHSEHGSGPCGRHEVTLVDVHFDRVEGPNANGFLEYWVTAIVRNSGTSPLDANDVPPLWPRFYDRNGRLFRGVSQGIGPNTGQTWYPGEVRSGGGYQRIHAERVGEIDHYRIDNGSGTFGDLPVGCVGCGRRLTDFPR